MFPGVFGEERLYLIEGRDQQPGVAGELEWIEPLVVASQASEFSQAERTNFVVSSFLCWREISKRQLNNFEFRINILIRQCDAVVL